MADIFGYKRNPKPSGVFSSEDSILTMTGMGRAEGFLVQNWNVAYTQQVQELFEIGSNLIYWAKGRPSGVGALSRVIGSKSGTDVFPRDAYDLCDGGVKMDLSAKSGACPGFGTSVRISMDGCVVTNIGFSMQVADVRLMENFQWRFAYMSI